MNTDVYFVDGNLGSSCHPPPRAAWFYSVHSDKMECKIVKRCAAPKSKRFNYGTYLKMIEIMHSRYRKNRDNNKRSSALEFTYSPSLKIGFRCATTSLFRSEIRENLLCREARSFDWFQELRCRSFQYWIGAYYIFVHNTKWARRQMNFGDFGPTK